MKKRFSLLLLMFSIIICGTNNVNVLANSKGERKPPKSVCVKEFEKKWIKFDDSVLKDIVKSYNLDLSGYQEFKHSDLNLKVGDKINDHSDKIS
ncbi:TPA: hypothetical protein VJR00_001793, partial [Streptococcus pyogenes]|nr:hypothetical protein [Streptococcus pyogenes]